MINILNNRLKFKERYLSLQTNSNINPKNNKNLLKKRIKGLYSFSNHLNKFSINKPGLVFKGLPFLKKGFSLTETDKILNLSPLSRKGLDLLKVIPKTKSTFLYPNSKLSTNISSIHVNPIKLNPQTPSLKKEDLADSVRNPMLLKNPEYVIYHTYSEKEDGYVPGTNNLKVKGISRKYPLSQAISQTPDPAIGKLLCSAAKLTGGDNIGLKDKRPAVIESESGVTPLLAKGILRVKNVNAKWKRDIKRSSAYSTMSSKEGASKLQTNCKLLCASPLPIGLVAKDSSGFAATLPRHSRSVAGGVSIKEESSVSILHNRLDKGVKIKNIYKPLPLAMYLELLKIYGTRYDIDWYPLMPKKSFNPDGTSSQSSDADKEKSKKKDIEEIKKERAIRKWKAACKKTKNKLIKIGAYTPQISDKNWLSFLEKVRLIIKSKYNFDSLLSRSQSVNYNFNKNYKKTNLNSIYKILKYFFASLSALISKPVFQFSPEKVNIRLFYFKIPTLPDLKKERKARSLVRKTGILSEKKKNSFQLREIMYKVRMKLFIAKWKESNNLIRLPNLSDTFSKLIADSSQIDLLQSSDALSPKAYRLSATAVSNTLAAMPEVQSMDLTQIKNRPQTGSRFAHAAVDYKPLSERDLAISDTYPSPIKELRTAPYGHGGEASEASLPPLAPKARAVCAACAREGGYATRSDSYEIIKAQTLATQLTGYASPSRSVEQTTVQETRFAPSPFKVADFAAPPLVSPFSGKGEGVGVRKRWNVGNGFKSLQTLKGKKFFNTTMVSLNENKFKYLVFILEKAFNKTVILDLVRLKYPYHDSNILAQVLGLNSNRRNFRQMMRKLLYTTTIKNPTKMIRKQNFSIIPSYLSGIKIRLAGRLITQRVVPRFTVQSIQMGSLARGKINYVDSSRLTLKNKRGAFSFTVSTSHIFESEKP